MTWSAALIVYFAVFAATQLLVWLGLRSEPTAHGHIVGHQVGCGLGLLWPIVLPYFVLLGLGYAFWRAWMWVRGKLQ